MQQCKWVIAMLVLFMLQIFKKCIQLNMISIYGIDNCIKQMHKILACTGNTCMDYGYVFLCSKKSVVTKAVKIYLYSII